MGLPEAQPPASKRLPRPNVYNLEGPEKDILSAAYRAISNGLTPGGPAGSPGSLRPSLGVQATIHDRYGSDPEHGVHAGGEGLFFGWHRAFLFYHEQLLQWALKNEGVDETTANSFRLPYWNPLQWSPQASFGVYGDPQRKELYRERGPKMYPPPPLKKSSGMEMEHEKGHQMVIMDWHARVHMWLCGDFTQPKTAGFDPLFYAFHAYVDLLCEKTHATGHIPDYWGIFYDAKADNNVATTPGKPPGWIQVNLKNVTDAAKLGYFYAS